MTRAVSDAKMLETIKTGDKIEFELARTGSNLVATKLNKIGEVAVVNGGAIYKINCAECRGDPGNGTTKGISLLKGHVPKHTETECIEQVTNSEEKRCLPSKTNYRLNKLRRP